MLLLLPEKSAAGYFARLGSTFPDTTASAWLQHAKPRLDFSELRTSNSILIVVFRQEMKKSNYYLWPIAFISNLDAMRMIMNQHLIFYFRLVPVCSTRLWWKLLPPGQIWERQATHQRCTYMFGNSKPWYRLLHQYGIRHTGEVDFGKNYNHLFSPGFELKIKSMDVFVLFLIF